MTASDILAPPRFGAAPAAVQPLEAVFDAPGCGVTELAPAARAAPKAPAFLFGGLPAYLARDMFSECAIGPVFCATLRGAAVTSDGIPLLDGAPLFSIAMNHPDYLVRNATAPGGQNRAALPVRRVAGRAAIIHGPGYNVFGHWLVDFLPRLYVLRQAGHRPETLRLILPADTPGFAHDFLNAIGIPPDNIIAHDHRNELLQPDELLLPSILRRASRLSPLFAEATRFWATLYLQGAPGPMSHGPGRKIFVSRGMARDSRHLRNRARIEALASAAGYHTVYPERLPLPDQIALFATATHIAGEYGSALHLALFAPPGSITCALRGASHHPGFVQSSLAAAFNQQIGYVLGHTPEHAGDHPFEIEPDAFSRALESMELCGPRL